MKKKGAERGLLLGLIILALIIACFLIVYFILKNKSVSMLDFIKNLIRFGR